VPDAVVHLVTSLGAIFGYAEPPDSPMRFWLALAVAYMVVVTWLAAAIARAPRANAHLMPILAAGKATSALLCLAFFVWQPLASGERVFIYLANFVVDASLVAVVATSAVALWLSSAPGERSVAGDRRLLDALLETLVPRGGPFALGGSDERV